MLSGGLFGHVLSDPEIASEFAALAFLDHMLAFERAWTEGLAEVGAVSKEIATAAVRAMKSPHLDALSDGSDRDGLPVPALVRALKDAAGDAAPAVHAGATSQDVIDTATVLTLRTVTATLSGRIGPIRDRLTVLADEAGDREMTGRTRMQAALPIPVRQRIEGWSTPLDRAAISLEDATKTLPVQIGGPVGRRDLPDGLAAAVARRLHLPLGAVWHTDRAPIVTYGHALTLLTGALGKMGQDIALMAQQGLDEITLSGGGSSSAMPHKSNPVEAESLVALARHVAALQGTLASALVHEQERSGTAWSLEWLTLPTMCEATGAACRAAERLLSRVERIG